MTDLLYRWPEAAKLGKVVPKQRFYEQGTATPGVREKFVAQVERIHWIYKLAEDTVNLRGSEAVPEIQVFLIEAKDANVGEDVLRAIDLAIKQPVIFEVSGSLGIRMTATPKQVGTRLPKIGSYYPTEWLARDVPRQPLPTSIDLPTLYLAILERLASVPFGPGEDVSQVAGRLAAVRRLEREISALEGKLRTEPQFNRKVDLLRNLKSKQAELSALNG